MKNIVLYLMCFLLCQFATIGYADIPLKQNLKDCKISSTLAGKITKQLDFIKAEKNANIGPEQSQALKNLDIFLKQLLPTQLQCLKKAIYKASSSLGEASSSLGHSSCKSCTEGCRKSGYNCPDCEIYCATKGFFFCGCE